MPDVRTLAAPVRRARRGDTLVECLVALAVAAGVFLPALALLRAAVRERAQVAQTAAEAVAARPVARTAASRLRLGLDVPELSVRLAPERVETRVVPAGPAEDDGPAPRAVLSRTATSKTLLLALPPSQERQDGP